MSPSTPIAHHFSPGKWGKFCRGMRDFLKIFDVSVMSYCGLLIIGTWIMAMIELLTVSDYVAPDWWVGPTGIFSITIGAILVKHTGGYFIASKYNSAQGERPIEYGQKPPEEH